MIKYTMVILALITSLTSFASAQKSDGEAANQNLNVKNERILNDFLLQTLKEEGLVFKVEYDERRNCSRMSAITEVCFDEKLGELICFLGPNGWDCYGLIQKDGFNNSGFGYDPTNRTVFDDLFSKKLKEKESVVECGERSRWCVRTGSLTKVCVDSEGDVWICVWAGLNWYCGIFGVRDSPQNFPD